MIKRDIEAIKKIYLEGVEKNTPEGIKSHPIFDLGNEETIDFVLNKETIEGLKLKEWVDNYKKEAMVSTAGIRGIQNVLYPWDFRFPFHYAGLTLATLAKCLVLKKENPNKLLNKIAAGEVRYNTRDYLEIISRVESAIGVKVHLPKGGKMIPIWLASFLIFINDYDGGEYVTASHAVTSKTATKDLDNEGSQFLPEKSLAFADKIKELIEEGESRGIIIKLAKKNNSLIVSDLDGVDEYVEYLRKGVLNEASIRLIKKQVENGLKITFDFGGGCMLDVMDSIFLKLGIKAALEYLREGQDPFFHGIGKVLRKNFDKGKEEFFDLSCDVSIIEVLKTMGFGDILKDKPLGHLVISVDPDGDRIVLMQIEERKKIPKLSGLGIDYIELDGDKVLAVYQPNFGFLMLFDYYARQLKQTGQFARHNRFIIKTTVTSKAWDEWAEKNGVRVVNTPVGFKEIAAVMKKAEKQIKANQEADIIIKDAFSKDINIGKLPRMLVGGEESGGMVFGPEEYIKSKQGRMAISMREKSAGESAVLACALSGYLFENKKMLSEYLESIFEDNEIKNRYYLRVDQTFYNESEPNPEILMQAKQQGEIQRDKIYSFYLCLSLAKKQGVISIENVKIILEKTFGGLDFAELQDIIFVGDGVYLDFPDMFIEVRKSGTDAKARLYFCGCDKQKCQIFSENMAKYKGDLIGEFRELIPEDLIEKAQELANEIYHEYFTNGL